MDATDGSWSLHAVSRQTSSNQKKKRIEKRKNSLRLGGKQLPIRLRCNPFRLPARGGGAAAGHEDTGGGGGGAVDPLDDLRPAVGASFFFTRRRGAARSHCHRSSSAVQSSSSPVEATRWTEMFFVSFPCISLSHFRQNVRHRCR